MTELYTDFIQKLRLRFGEFADEQKRFEKASNSEIARELGYSDAQFSRLINETATPGEYQRAIQNIERILTIIHLEAELEKKERKEETKKGWRGSPLWIVTTILLAVFVLAFLLFGNFILPDRDKLNAAVVPRDHTLKWAFETSFIDPYVKLDDLPADCNYPCYKYQGKWKLDKGYKIPFFRERNGFHYLATEATLYARCMSEESTEGNIIEGYEYQQHEIWYNLRELPIDSFFAEGNLTEDYQNLDFSKDDNFVKIATVHTFFRNEFTIDSTLIYRRGKVIGRDLEFVSEESLQQMLADEEKVQDIENALNRIARNRLSDFSMPISCDEAPVPALDFHAVKDGDIMSFNCQLTTSRVSMDYTKAFVLTDQYIKNSCRATQ